MRRFFCLLIFFCSFQLYSEQFTVKFYLSNNEVYAHDFDSDIRLLNLSDTLFGFDDILEDYYITKIEGFEQFKNLRILEIRDFMNILDFSFLDDLPNLTELYIDSSLVEDISFLSNLENLEIIDLFIYVREENAQNFFQSEIDLSQLLFLARINFKAMILPEDGKSDIPFNSIPNFANVQNQPQIHLGHNEISTLDENQIDLLRQYSQIFLYPNPILNNDEEMEKLKGLMIVVR